MTTTATRTAASTADEIVTAAKAALARRIANETPDGWSDAAAWRRYHTVLTAVTVWKRDAHTVVATVPNTHDGHTWAYVAGDVLDVELTDALFARAHINQVNETTCTITI